MFFLKKIRNSFRFFVIAIMPERNKRKVLKGIFKHISSVFVVFCAIIILSYYFAWTFIASNIQKNISSFFSKSINKNNSYGSFKITDVKNIKVVGFPFKIEILIDKISFESRFIYSLEAQKIRLRYHIFSTKKRLNLSEIEDFFIFPTKDGPKYSIFFETQPKLEMIFDNNDMIERILYQDNGYRVIDMSTMDVTDLIDKNFLNYSANFDPVRRKKTYNINFNTIIDLNTTTSDGIDIINSIGLMDIMLNISGEEVGDENFETNSVTINNFIFKNKSFLITGYGSILNTDRNTFKINIEILPYKKVSDMLANYFLAKNDLFINKKDVGRYYTAIRQIILPKLITNQENRELNIQIIKDKEGDISINNKFSLDYVFSVLSAARYDIIYSGSR